MADRNSLPTATQRDLDSARTTRRRDLGLLIIRVGFGLGFAWFHGLPKLLGGPERWTGTGDAVQYFGIGFGHQAFGLAAALGETVGGALLALGLLFRPAAAALLVVMIVAATSHLVTGQGSPGHAIKNAFLFAGLLFVGPGGYTLDALLVRRRAAPDVR